MSYFSRIVYLAAFVSIVASHAQIVSVTSATPDSSQSVKVTAQDARDNITIKARLRLRQADPKARNASLTLVVESDYTDQKIKPQDRNAVARPTRLLINLPLASTTDAYGESRECNVSKEGQLTFVFTAGLDEKNFIAFQSSDTSRDFAFSLNKYLCRVLAAPFHCGMPGRPKTEVKFAPDLSNWKIGTHVWVDLASNGADAKAEIEGASITSDGKPFDYAQCAVIAPSNGLCCVQHKTTEWHCGGTPVGDGWHQVSGDCFHRETGGSCKE